MSRTVHIARVTIRGTDTVETVAAYLPSNYAVLAVDQDGSVIIGGIDNHGWTLDAYVIPRLASGMIHCEQIPLDLESISKYDRRELLGETS
jgi:hypothetical protein